MTYGNAQIPEPPKPSNNRKLVIALVFLAAAVTLLCCAGIVSGAFGSKDEAGSKLITPEATFESASVGASVGAAVGKTPTAAAPKVNTDQAPSASNVKLTVKTTSKECFGSAGCNVQWTIKMSLPDTVRVTEPCEVTYEVRGLDQTQTHTLSIESNDTFSQDPFSFGQTASSGKKLTAKVTEVECE